MGGKGRTNGGDSLDGEVVSRGVGLRRDNAKRSRELEEKKRKAGDWPT